MKHTRYHYTVIVKSVYDGDTCIVDIDAGFSPWMHGEKI